MNTAKQVNVMVGLLMVFIIGTLLYFLWDSERASDAEQRQADVSAERGGALFARNCRSCHGITGTGALEISTLPGAPLNVDANRSTDPGALAQKQARFRDTLVCGRVGTIMPPWSQEQGGALNDYQIEQLVALITSQSWEKGWEVAIERANHDDKLGKYLLDSVSESDVVFTLNNPYNLKPGAVLRIDDEPVDGVYELVTVVRAPANTVLVEDISADQTEIAVQEPTVFLPGDRLTIDHELVTVQDSPLGTTLTEDVSASGTTLVLGSTRGLLAGDILVVGQEHTKVVSVSGLEAEVQRGVEDTGAVAHVAGTRVSEPGLTIVVLRGQSGTTAEDHRATTPVLEVGDSIQVERGAKGSEAASHVEGAEVFAGPIPGGDTITGGGEGNPPCGQKSTSGATAGTPTPAATYTGPTLSEGQPEWPSTAQPVDAEVTEPEDGRIEVETQDSLFVPNNLKVAIGEEVTIAVKNAGTAIHNLRMSPLLKKCQESEPSSIFMSGLKPLLLNITRGCECSVMQV